MFMLRSSSDHGLRDNPQRQDRVADHPDDERKVPQAGIREWGIPLDCDVVGRYDCNNVPDDDQKHL